MLVDIEPGYESLVLGEEIEARCRWIDASALPIDSFHTISLLIAALRWEVNRGAPCCDLHFLSFLVSAIPSCLRIALAECAVIARHRNPAPLRGPSWCDS